MKKGKTNNLGRRILSIVLTVALVVGLMPGNMLTVKAEEIPSKPLSVTAFATPEQLMSSDNFALHTDTGSGTAQKVYFGTNGSNKQTWYIAGSDAADSIVLLCDPSLPMATGTMFENDLGNNKSYSADWRCTYETAPNEVYPNHYGASDLRGVLQKYTSNDNTEKFSAAEKELMQSTKVYTDDDKRKDESETDYTYYTEDVLYPAYGDYHDDKYITVGANSAESLNGGLKVSLTSAPYNGGDIFWLRAPYYDISSPALVANPGHCVGIDDVDDVLSVVPAFRLNLSSVLFASAATAATSDASLTDTMTFRVDGDDKITSQASYSTDSVIVDATEEETVYLYVQGKDGTTDWVYSQEVSADTTIATGTIKSGAKDSNGRAVSLTSVDLSQCEIWIEKKVTDDNLVYAVMAKEIETIAMVAVTDITAPVAGAELDVAATCNTTGVSTTTPTVSYTKNGESVAGNAAGYLAGYTATVELEAAVDYAFTNETTATINGNEASVSYDADTGKLTVSYTFDKTAKLPLGNAYYVTKDELMSSFDLDGTDDTVGKVYFGTKGSNKQTWYIAGSDAADSIVLLCDPSLPMATDTMFENDWKNNKTYSADWRCTYETAPNEVYPNHYGASDLRGVLQGYTSNDNTEKFSAAEKELMQSTKVYTDDDKRKDEGETDYTYYTEDVLYPAYGDYNDDKFITVGANSADSLNGGLKVSLKSAPYNSGDIFWLRAPDDNYSNHALVARPGYCVNHYHVLNAYSVVPAFRLNLSSVLFSSAATAATSGARLTDTMTFRVDDTEKIKSKAAYATCGVTVNYDEGDGNVFLYVQDADSVYSVEITEDTTVALSDMTGIESLTAENTKIWLEKSEDNVAYALMAEAVLTEHIPNEDDGDCTTSITCRVCGTVTTEAEAEHIDSDDDGICDQCNSYEAPELVDEYYQIANAGNLMWFVQQVNEGQTTINAKLTADIAMNGIDWTMMSSFAGTFDGNGYTISGLNGHKAYTENTHGFIRTLADGGVVKNLTFTEADIWNHEDSGAISAVIVYTNNGTVENCVVKSSLIQLGNYDALGVVVGSNGGAIRNCASISNKVKRRYEGVKSKAASVFVWSNVTNAIIENCIVYDCTYEDASANYAFTKSNTGTITNCYYYESSETISDTVATAKTADQFASGEVAYLLNGEKTDGTQSWYQTLETDTYPVPDNTHGTVYYGYVDYQSQDKIYANTELSKDKPEHSWKCELDEANTNKMTFSCTTDGCTKGGTITVTGPKDATYNGSNHSATVSVETKENEELIETPVITYTSLTEGVELLDGKPVNAGTYQANVSFEGVLSYQKFEIKKATPNIGTVSAEGMENTLDISKVVLSRTDDTISGTLSLKEGTKLAYGTNDYTYVFKSGDANYNDVEGTVRITISDTNAPTATYKVGTDGWKQFINTITFGHFCKGYTTVDITYSDEGSGVANKQYYISKEEITNTENIQWSEYTDTLNINATGKYYIYVRVTDNYGNVVIQNSEGIVVYAESVITPTSFSCEYGEENALYVNISTNGNTFANLTDGSGNEIATENYSIDGSTLTIKGEYLSDLDVGEYTYKICMNPQGVENTEVTLAYSFVVNVIAKELTVTGATAASRDYIANDKTVDITGITLSGIQGTDDVSVEITGLKGTLSSANAGDYTEVTLPALKLTGKDKDNYVLTQPSKAVPTNVTISPQATGTAQNVTKKYLFSQENADTINLVSLLPKDCGTVVSYGTPAVDGNVTYKVAPSIEEGTLAYTVADGLVGNTGTITIDAKTQNYTSVPITISVALVDQIPVMQQTEVTLKDESQKLTYGQKLSVLELTEVVFKGTDGETVTGTLQWKNGDSVPTVDTKKATWEFVPSASYNDKYATEEGELTISVVPATPEVDTLPTVNAITYHPDTTLADIALSGGKMNGIAGELTGTWAWKGASICPKAGDNTYVAVFTPEDSTNYKTKEVDITVSVAKATPYIKTAVAAKAITYGATLKDSALSGGAVQYSETDETAVAGSWSWKEVTKKPVVADSKVTEYDVVFTPTDAENYNKVETKITLTVNKSETTPNMPESTMSALYSQKTVGALELPEGWVWNEAYSAKELTVDVAVEATAIYNGADKGNYVTESVTISITRQACDHEESDILYTGEGEKAPTCTVDGIGHTECTKCKEPMQTNVTVEASGHTGGTATCKNKAECSTCHEGYGELDKNNHAGETEVKDAKKATCAVDGYTGDTYCKDCGAKIATGTKIDKSIAHTWDNGVVTKEATATEKGEKTYTCSACKTTKKEEIPALGAPKVGEEIASEDGSATYKVTEAGENGNSVTYEAPTDKNQATVVVPATVTINNITYNVTTISDTAFAGNKKITSVTIGDNVTGFSDKTFKGCSNLKTVDVGNGVTSIPANAFKNFKNLTTVKMGTGVKTIGKNAFYGCKKLKNLTLGENVVTIGDKAFYKCTSLTKLTIPSKVKTIGKSAFYGCKALKTITIGKSVTKIGSKAFYGCSKTKTLTIKSSKLTTKKIGSKAFTKTPKSMTVKVPKKKFKAYKSMFIKRGVNKKAKFRKS